MVVIIKKSKIILWLKKYFQNILLPLSRIGLRYLDSVRSSLHLSLQTSFLLTLLAQPPLQLLLLLSHTLNTSLQL